MGDNALTNFKRGVLHDARNAMAMLLGSEEGQKAGAKVAMAFVSAVHNAKDPSALLNASTDSIRACIAASADTGIMPGGAYPKVWLVPRGGKLQWEISHRGICALAQRAGIKLRAVPVHVNDESLRLEFGEVVAHTPPPDLWPERLEDLMGVYVIAQRISDGATMSRSWVPAALISKRANSRQAGPVWKQWPVEMAQKTAIKYLMARGELVIDNPEIDRAFAVDAEWSHVTTAPVPQVASNASPEQEAAALLLDEAPVIPTGDPAHCEALETEYKGRIGDGWQALLEQAGGSIAKPLNDQSEDVRSRYSGLLSEALDAEPEF